jgi:ABC-type sugar transport system substrate-binding protein
LLFILNNKNTKNTKLGGNLYKMKKLFTVFMAFFAVFALAACNGGGDEKEIAVIMPSADHGFLGESINHAEAATERLATEHGYKFRFLISDDIVEQSAQIDQVIADKVDVVVLWPHNGDELKSAAQQIVDAGIPLIIYVKFQEWSTNWSKDTAQQQMETFLSTSSQADVEAIKAVFTHDAEVAAGVLAAIEAYDGDYTINIELVSAVSASRELLSLFDHYEAMGINQVVFSFSPAMVVDAIELGIDILDGETVSGQYLVPTEMVDNSNFEAFMQGPVYTLRYSLDEE